ncbi:MAG: hypothetical protein M1816_002607 [Peltula sp. TS41687]|nr:MAG: hypothetical protein M1816_002607 [Peltula sp. TS41687]
MADATSYDSSLVGSTVVNGSERSIQDEPTESHAMAVADYDDPGAAQQYHDVAEVKDLGWHEDAVPTPLVAGLSNDQLYTLIRRFNKQMYHVKAIHYPPPGGLDLNISDEEEFSPDKLRGNIERLSLALFTLQNTLRVYDRGMNIDARVLFLRYEFYSHTKRKTAHIKQVYYIAWFLNLLGPLFFSTLIALIVYPPSRSYLFPHAPLALVDSKTGGLKKPGAGMLGSHNTLTGAPEKHEGEALEQEAHNFVNSVAAIGLSATVGKKNSHQQSEENAKAIDKSIPDPTHLTTATTSSKNASTGMERSTKHDKTKQPMEEQMWEKARPVMRALGDAADVWERFSNNILYGVPTNAQLTLTLLRIGEANKAPLPPPPHSEHAPSARPPSLHGDDVPLDASHEEIQDVIHPDSSDPKVPGQEHLSPPPQQKHKHGRKVLQFLKSTTRAGVSTILGTDRLKATVGDENAKQRLGVLPDPSEADVSGPVDFLARHHGKKGHLYLRTAAEPPSVMYSYESTAAKAEAHSPVFTVPIADITELKKIGGLGWKFKFVVTWAMDREVADGLEIVNSRGESHVLTAIPLRDELFNRLIAIDRQKWESW